MAEVPHLSDQENEDESFDYGDVTLEDTESGSLTNYENFDALYRCVQADKQDAPAVVRADLVQRPVVIDDFIRNFLVKRQFRRTIESFEQEWYERYGATAEQEPEIVEDLYVENTRLVDRVSELERDLAKRAELSRKAVAMWEQLKKERDQHRANHNRVIQEKNVLMNDLKRLHAHTLTIEPTLMELRHRYDKVQKEKGLLRMERDKLQARIVLLEEEQTGLGDNMLPGIRNANNNLKNKGGLQKHAGDVFTWPPDVRQNPYLTAPLSADNVSPQLTISPPENPSGYRLKSTFKAHTMTVTSLSVLPKKHVVATASDDGTWRLFSLPHGELILSGEGHNDWISSICVHPTGSMCATASGDKTIKIWNFVSASCRNTLKAHTDGVWSVDFQETGHLLVSGSLDKSARVWDVETGKCRQTIRGHVDAVNSVVWQPYSNIICTGSGDKTVSLWDARANFCAQTYYGHQNAVAKVAVSLAGNRLASCDADGTTLIWDTRMVDQQASYSFNQCPANSVAFDRSGSLMAIASDDKMIRVVNLNDDQVYTLQGHEDAVQSAVFSAQDDDPYLISCGSDLTVRYWSC